MMTKISTLLISTLTVAAAHTGFAAEKINVAEANGLSAELTAQRVHIGRKESAVARLRLTNTQTTPIQLFDTKAFALTFIAMDGQRYASPPAQMRTARFQPPTAVLFAPGESHDFWVRASTARLIKITEAVAAPSFAAMRAAKSEPIALPPGNYMIAITPAFRTFPAKGKTSSTAPFYIGSLDELRTELVLENKDYVLNPKLAAQAALVIVKPSRYKMGRVSEGVVSTTGKPSAILKGEWDLTQELCFLTKPVKKTSDEPRITSLRYLRRDDQGKWWSINN